MCSKLCLLRYSKLQYLVKSRRIKLWLGADREQSPHVATENFSVKNGFAGIYPVTVLSDDVDLTVVSDEPVGMR